MTDLVILVDEQDRQIGVMEKLEAHQKGLLHRAISVILFNSIGEMLVHQRAEGKYHSPELWTNACCSHPRPGESAADAAARRLIEEMGIDAPLTFAYSFRYKAELGVLTENEFDHVFVGYSDVPPRPDRSEVRDWAFRSVPELRESIEKNPEAYTAWFRIMMNDPRTAQLDGFRSRN